MRKWLNWSIALSLLAALMFQGVGQTQQKPAGAVRVFNYVSAVNDEGKTIEFYVLATLYKDGDAVRSSQIESEGKGYSNKRVEWEGLPLGKYEVHFEAQGYGKVIKRIVVSSDARTMVVIDSMSRNDEVWGAGPTLFELQKRIQTLEAELAALKKAR